MAAPTRESVTTTDFAVNATAHAADMPATVNAGDLLLALVAMDSAAETLNTPSGWTKLFEMAAGSDPSFAVFGKVAVGDEASTAVDFSTAGSESGTVQVYRISGWGGTLTGSICIGGTYGAGTTAGIALTVPAASQDLLWILVQAKSSASGFGAAPGSFTDTVTSGQDSSTGAAIASAVLAETSVRSIEVNGAFNAASAMPLLLIAVLSTDITPGGGGVASLINGGLVQ